MAGGVSLQDRRILLEHPDGEQQEVIEIQPPALATLPLIGAEQPHAGAHQLAALRVIGHLGPFREAVERHQLLLQALEHLQQRSDQVIRALVSGQRHVGQAPHELAGEDPPFRPGQDPEAWRHSDGAAVLAQPAQGEGVERAHRRRRPVDQPLDALTHLGGRPLCESHDEDRFRRHTRRDQAPEPLRDDRCLTRARAGHDAHRAGAQRRRAQLLAPELHAAGTIKSVTTGRCARAGFGPSAPGPGGSAAPGSTPHPAAAGAPGRGSTC